MAVTTLYAVRHGQSTWNATGLLQGQAPGPELTPLGYEQAFTAAVALAGTRIDAIHSSDLHRAVQTAEVLGEQLGAPVHVTPALRERGYGSLEGQPSGRAVQLAGDIDWLDPAVRPGGGESLRDVHSRVGGWVTRCVERDPDAALVLVSHGDTIRILIACVAGLGPHEIPWADVANGSVTTLVVPSASR